MYTEADDDAEVQGTSDPDDPENVLHVILEPMPPIAADEPQPSSSSTSAKPHVLGQAEIVDPEEAIPAAMEVHDP